MVLFTNKEASICGRRILILEQDVRNMKQQPSQCLRIEFKLITTRKPGYRPRPNAYQNGIGAAFNRSTKFYLFSFQAIPNLIGLV